MTRTEYAIPQRVALAVVTDRIDFLAHATDAELSSEDVRKLLKDLILDRVQLRQEVHKAVDDLSEVRGQFDACLRKYNRLLGILDGDYSEGDDNAD